MNTANTVLAENSISKRLYARMNNMLQAAGSWTESCGVIAAAAHSVDSGTLQELESRLNLAGENPGVVAAYEADANLLLILLPGQALAYTHFAALSVKALLQEAGLPAGGMAIACFSESAPATEPDLNEFLSLLNGMDQEEIAVYDGPLSSPATPTVVMIDPNADLLEFLNVRLGRQGYDVRPAQDGKEGLRLVESVRPDLVITELTLPALDGYQVIQRIRKSQSRSCKVVVLTDLSVEQHICKCFELGAADVIKKPFSPMELEARLRRLLA
ncbi:response regulator transcription factor [Paenibacillus hamazuiensis]|uniref:response regulator transcription factor n=1 Tax=Paenibacillus hamazuiensis TaxID=2936508 RepID=UPI00200CFBAC|nr:response regulator transcription factor [Paenibacillus hamazuiensis]